MLTISGKCLDDWVNTGLNLNQRSEDFFKREVDYLEQVVSAAGYRLDHSNVEAVRTLKDSSLAQLVHASEEVTGSSWVLPQVYPELC